MVPVPEYMSPVGESPSNGFTEVKIINLRNDHNVESYNRLSYVFIIRFINLRNINCNIVVDNNKVTALIGNRQIISIEYVNISAPDANYRLEWCRSFAPLDRINRYLVSLLDTYYAGLVHYNGQTYDDSLLELVNDVLQYEEEAYLEELEQYYLSRAYILAGRDDDD
jgi:hypothetical protein